ncbi:MAG TPA: hypothetical protein VG266_08490 [Candidatus Dormibacteraeota bacterium]|jgi:hypothetical protein|nr:hypothetical protein [Candidatus Dormibacteraeota bacterium]
MIGHIRAGIATAVIACAAVGFVACGSSSGGGANNDSPGNSVRGFINALGSGNLQSACDWVAPSQKASCTSALAVAQNLGGSFSVSVADFSVVSENIDSSGNKASVVATGNIKVCLAGQCSTSSLSAGAANVNNTVPCIKENGKWYVDFGAANLLGGGGGGGASPGSAGSSTLSAPSLPPGPTDTGTTSSSS